MTILLSDAEFETRVAAADTLAALWHVVTAFFSGTDVTRVIYHHLPPMGAPDASGVRIRAHGLPPELKRFYIDGKAYRDNPALPVAMRRVEPVYIDEIAGAENLTGAQREFVEVARELDVLRGMAVPVFGPNGRNGYCGLGFRAGVTRLDPVEVRRLQWVCQQGHLRYCALLLPTLGPTPQLSERETEVLGWVARGKSNTSIGEILGISTHTVDTHLRHIYLKLGVFDRISASLRAIGVGLIHAAP